MITVVTGGSRGIGAAVVRKFAQAGHQVYFLYRSSHQQAQALCRETGAVAIQADVADEASVQAAFSRIPSVDTLICNAGIVSSMWGQAGASCEAAYSATKGAVIALTKSLAKELAPSGVRVNCIAPGVIQTQMLSNLSSQDLQALSEQTPLGRLGTPEEVADAMVFLASEAARFITGQVLSLDGGFLL